MAVCFFGSLNNLGVGCVTAAVSNIFHQGAMKEHRLLRHKGDSIAEALLRYLCNILPVYLDSAALYIKETQKQLGNSCFAGTRRAHECNFLITGNREIKVVEHAFVCSKAKINV